MTQNARLALYIPTGPDADPGEIIEIRGNAPVGSPIPTRFFAQAGATGGIGEAPADNKAYARRNVDWEVSVLEAPNDGNLWARKSNSWQQVAPFPEAPTDGAQYARQNAGWVEIVVPILDGGEF